MVRFILVLLRRFQDDLKKGGFIEKLGGNIFYNDSQAAINDIHSRIEKTCDEKVFDECNCCE